MLCSHSPSEETINQGHKTAIPSTHALICDELKDPGIPLKGGTIIVCVEKVSVTEQITSMACTRIKLVKLMSLWYIGCRAVSQI